MKVKEYQEMSKRTMPNPVVGKHGEYYDKSQITNFIMGLAGETGELIDLIKKEWYHNHPTTDQEKKKELGDIFFYLFGLCTMLEYDVEEVMTLNLMKLAERYPNGFNSDDSIRRVDVK